MWWGYSTDDRAFHCHDDDYAYVHLRGSATSQNHRRDRSSIGRKFTVEARYSYFGVDHHCPPQPPPQTVPACGQLRFLTTDHDAQIPHGPVLPSPYPPAPGLSVPYLIASAVRVLSHGSSSGSSSATRSHPQLEATSRSRPTASSPQTPRTLGSSST